MHIVLASILRSSEEGQKPVFVEAESSGYQVGPSILTAMQRYEGRTQEQDSIYDIYKALTFATSEVRQTKMQLEYLLYPDRLQMSLEVPRDWCKMMDDLSFHMKSIDDNLTKISAQCDAWYNSRKVSSAVRLWKDNYDRVRRDVQEIHESVARFLKYADDVQAHLLNKFRVGQSHGDNHGLKRTLSPSSTSYPFKRLKQD
jgi:hypothetical protein